MHMQLKPKYSQTLNNLMATYSCGPLTNNKARTSPPPPPKDKRRARVGRGDLITNPTHYLYLL